MREKPSYGHAELVAAASNEPHDNSRARWTELAVHHDPDNASRPWFGVIRACSTYPGEVTREQVVQVGTLERALRLFDAGSALTRAIALEAEDWEERRRAEQQDRPGLRDAPLGFRASPADAKVLLADQGHKRLGDLQVGDELMPGPEPFTGTTQDEALAWLFGDLLDKSKPQTLVARLFGVGESSVRMQIAEGRDIKIAFKAAARFMDRDAVRRALAPPKEPGDGRS
jgi:hypothetical protein